MYVWYTLGCAAKSKWKWKNNTRKPWSMKIAQNPLYCQDMCGANEKQEKRILILNGQLILETLTTGVALKCVICVTWKHTKSQSVPESMRLNQHSELLNNCIYKYYVLLNSKMLENQAWLMTDALIRVSIRKNFKSQAMINWI